MPEEQAQELELPEIKSRQYEKEELVEEKPEYSREEASEEPKTVVAQIKPIFVSVNEYKNILNNANALRARLLTAEEHMNKLTEIKKMEEKAFGSWRAKLEDLDKKLAYVDNLITKAR